jgi:two-component system CitB family sensor kinase
MRSGKRGTGRWGLARQLLLLQVGVVAVVVALGAAVNITTASGDADTASRDQVIAIADTLGQSPSVLAALRTPEPTKLLQPEATAVQQRTGTSFVVFMSPEGIRYSHPDPAEIGKHFVGDIGPAQHGTTFAEEFRGTLGPSVRAVAPIEDASGHIVGLVAVGVLLRQVSAVATHQLPGLIGLAGLALVLGTVGSLLLARRVRRQTLGLEPAAIARQYQHHDAMLHAVREGLIITDREGKLVLANDEARRLLGLPAGGEGRALAGQLGDPYLAEVICGRPDEAGEPVRDEVVVAAERVLVVSRGPAEVDGRAVGSVTTLRDRTELQQTLQELGAVRALADSLRTQAHESANRLQALVGLVELGRSEEAVQLGTREAQTAQALSDRLLDRVGEPALVALLLGKTAVADERGVRLRITEETAAESLRVPLQDVLTVVGNLLDNAVDAACSTEQPGGGWVELTLGEVGEGGLYVQVRDSGPGVAPEAVERIFSRGYSTKDPDSSASLGGRGIGLALVRQVAARLGGSVELLPGEGGAVFEAVLPAQPQLEVAP